MMLFVNNIFKRGSYFDLKTRESRSDRDLVRLPQLCAFCDALDDRVCSIVVAVVAVDGRIQTLSQILLPLQAGPEAATETIHLARTCAFEAVQILKLSFVVNFGSYFEK